MWTHEHDAAYSPDCPACQDFDDRFYATMANTGRTSRPAPMSARNVRVRHHSLDCKCATCRPFLLDTVSPSVGLSMRLFVWLCRQWWDWTPAGQLIYWTFALAALATYR